MLTAQNIHQSFGQHFGAHHVLHDVSLRIAPSSITCLIGPSGAGKTTLLRALVQLDSITSGTVLLDNKRITQAAPAWPDVTLVFQSLFLWPHLTLRENIDLPARGRVPDNIERVQALADLSAAFDMDAFLDRYPAQTSLGQRQRAALARACILRPRFLLLDEITSALDVEHIERVLDYLQSLRLGGTGIILSTHLLGFARRVADQVIFLDGGRALESGTASILKTPQTPRLQRFIKTLEASS